MFKLKIEFMWFTSNANNNAIHLNRHPELSTKYGNLRNVRPSVSLSRLTPHLSESTEIFNGHLINSNLNRQISYESYEKKNKNKKNTIAKGIEFVVWEYQLNQCMQLTRAIVQHTQPL